MHFHGSQKLLLATINCLLNFHAGVNLKDKEGSIALHKAIQICPSKNAAIILKLLLMHNMNPNIVNKSNEMALHIECKRLRSASPEVVNLLIQANANVNAKSTFIGINENNQNHNHKTSSTPLSLTIEQATLSAYSLEELMNIAKYRNGSHGHNNNLHDGSALTTHSLSLSDRSTSSFTAAAVTEKNDTTHRFMTSPSARKVWIKVASQLIEAGAVWDLSWRNHHGSTLMHLLLSTFPPPRKQMDEYIILVNSATKAGLNLFTDDDFGRTPIFILCERFSMISVDNYPDAIGFMKSLIQIARNHNRNNGNMTVYSSNDKQQNKDNSFELFSNHQGKTIFDLPDYVNSSCLSVCKTFLAEMAIPTDDELSHLVRDNEQESTLFMNQISLFSPLTSSPSSTLQNSNLKSVSKSYLSKYDMKTVKPASSSSSQVLSSYYNLSPSISSSSSGNKALSSSHNMNSSHKRLHYNRLDSK